MQQLALAYTTFRISSHYSISKVAHKLKMNQEYIDYLNEIGEEIGDIKPALFELGDNFEEFQKETESELINLRKAMDKMNKRIEEICSLLKFPATTQVGRKARSVLSGAGGW